MRVFYCSMLIINSLVLGCQSSEKSALQPLPPDAPLLTYSETVQRIEAQTRLALESFYRDKWVEVLQAGIALEESSELLQKHVKNKKPENLKKQLQDHAQQLTSLAQTLQENSKKQDAVLTTQTFQKLHLLIRELRRQK